MKRFNIQYNLKELQSSSLDDVKNVDSKGQELLEAINYMLKDISDNKVGTLTKNMAIMAVKWVCASDYDSTQAALILYDCFADEKDTKTMKQVDIHDVCLLFLRSAYLEDIIEHVMTNLMLHFIKIQLPDLIGGIGNEVKSHLMN